MRYVYCFCINLSFKKGTLAMADKYCRKCKSKLTKCPKCKGKGTTSQGSVLSGYSQKPCPNCNGTGKLCPKHGYDWG